MFQIIVGGSKRAKKILETGRLYRTKQYAFKAIERLRKKASDNHLYPETYWVLKAEA